MRIIAGTFKGRRLAAVRGRLRPTAEKVREAVFDILGTAVHQARVLDLFAGTGALGIEALSRGAREAVLVEDHPVALAVLRRNLETLGLGPKARVMPLSVPGALKKLAAKREQFNLAFLDPPYGQGLASSTLASLTALGLLASPAWVVAEHSRREKLPERFNRLKLWELRRYGDTQVGFYLAGDDPDVEELLA